MNNIGGCNGIYVGVGVLVMSWLCCTDMLVARCDVGIGVDVYVL